MAEKKPEWALANGQPKPEWRLALKKPLSDGTKELILMEAPIGVIRRARKLVEFTGQADSNGDRMVSPGALEDYGIALIAGTTNLPEAIIEELPHSVYRQAMEYLDSF